jgi:hypothetical protein
VVCAQPPCDKAILVSKRLGNIVPGAFTPVLAKHSKSFSLIDCISVGVDRMQRNFEPMRRQLEAWQRSELTDVIAKVVIYEAFVEGQAGSSQTPCPNRTCTLNRSTRNFVHEPSGACRMPSPRYSKSWIPFLSSKLLLSWRIPRSPVHTIVLD